MRARIAALALALAFVAAPAFASIARAECTPCPSDRGPCSTSFADSCCCELAPAAPAKTTTVEAPTLCASASLPLAFDPAPACALAPLAAHEIAATSPLRLSVVLRL